MEISANANVAVPDANADAETSEFLPAEPTGFNFETRIRLAAEKKERQKQQNRDRQAKWKSLHRAPNIEARWQMNLAALSQTERDDLEALRLRNAELVELILDTIHGISSGRIAGREMLYPDALFTEIKRHLVNHPTVQSLAPKALLCDLDVKSIARFDDRALIDYGVETRIFEGFWIEFCRAALAWANANSSECDLALRNGILILVQGNDHAPVPAPPLPAAMSEREREGYIAAAESQKDHQTALAAEQIKWFARNTGQGTDNVPV